MKQSETTSKQSSLLASATEDEIIVSQILLDLKSLVSLSESLANFNWGCRRRRSCLDEDPPLRHEPSCPPPLVQRTENEIEERRLQIKASEVQEEKGGDATGTTASPNTPLSFSPSESDEKFKHSSKKTSRKRSREDYIDIIEGLTQSRDVLRGEVENVKKFYNKLKAYNSELKAMKQEIQRRSRNFNIRLAQSKPDVAHPIIMGRHAPMIWAHLGSILTSQLQRLLESRWMRAMP